MLRMIETLTLVKFGFALCILVYVYLMRRFREFFLHAEGFGLGFLRRLGFHDHTIEKIMFGYMCCLVAFSLVLLLSTLEDLLLLLK